ncbi:MAG: hypothetical protein K2W85_05105 [Phycisphaerales bacterium]|nr:hypothetical protein [Phycisphaerales bacterium]
MTSTHSPPPPPPPTSTIHEIGPDDVGPVAELIHREATGTPASPELAKTITARMRWLLADNPANLPGVPWGWLLKDDQSQVVGAMTCTPLRVACGTWTSTAMMSAKWFVNEAHRGAGLGLFLRYLKLGKTHPLIATTAGPQSVPLWEKFGGFAISDSDHECVGALRVGPLAEEVLHRKVKSVAVAKLGGALATVIPAGLRSARKAGKSVTLDRLSSADDVVAMGLRGPENVISTIRDRSFLHWRHFSGPDAAAESGREVLACTMPSGSRALVITQSARRGYRSQTRTLSVLDVWGNLTPAEMPALAGALARRSGSSCDAIVFRALAADGQRALTASGFVRRTFAQPTTWCIDKANLTPTRSWYLVAGDAE